MYGGEVQIGLRPGPFDLEQLLINDQASRQFSPASMRNSSEASRFYEGLIPQPVKELSDSGAGMPILALPSPASLTQVGTIPSPGVSVGF